VDFRFDPLMMTAINTRYG